MAQLLALLTFPVPPSVARVLVGATEFDDRPCIASPLILYSNGQSHIKQGAGERRVDHIQAGGYIVNGLPCCKTYLNPDKPFLSCFV